MYHKPLITSAYYICPNCHKIVVCNCNACKTRRKKYGIKNFKEIIVDKKNDLFICPYCNHKDVLDAFCGWKDFACDIKTKTCV